MSDREKSMSPIMAAEMLTPWWMKRIQDFDGLEIQTCKTSVMVPSDKDITKSCELDSGYFWTVYGHYRPDRKKAGREALGDFETEGEAKKFYDRLLETYPHLAVRPQIRQQPHNKLIQ